VGQGHLPGQFATPPRLAVEIASYAWSHCKGRKEPIRFLDPALGTGSFYSALRQIFPPEVIGAAAGIELDPAFAAMAASLWGATGLHVLNADFTTSAVPPSVARESSSEIGPKSG
jgi:hypothetical protein